MITTATRPTRSQFKLTPQDILIYLLLTLSAMLLLFPVYYGLMLSTQSYAQAVGYPPQLIPGGLDQAQANYAKALIQSPLVRYMLNSMIMASAITLGHLITGALAAYAFSFLAFRGRDLLFLVFLSTIMIPWEVTIISNYLTVVQLGWKNSFTGLIIPSLATAFGTFLLRQAFLTVPRDLRDAATMDGCGDFRFLIEIVLPITRGALGTLGIYSFIQAWNSYLWPLLITDVKDMRTVQIGVVYLRETDFIQPQIIMAGAFIVVAPTLLALVIGQRQLIRGLTAGSIKG